MEQLKEKAEMNGFFVTTLQKREAEIHTKYSSRRKDGLLFLKRNFSHFKNYSKPFMGSVMEYKYAIQDCLTTRNVFLQRKKEKV